MDNDETNPIETATAQACARLLETASARSEEPRPSRNKALDAIEIACQLGERGYPLRHREHLGMMHGPSLQKANALLSRVKGGDALLLLVGDRGPGKTQMATFWAAKRRENGQSCGWYRKTTDLIAEIRQTWSDGGKSHGTESDVLAKYRRTPFLVLDEFHERGDSDWESRTLVNIIDHRYDAMLATVLIANMNPAEVRFKINPSIVSRAEETGGLIVCDWESYRKAA
jgi:DNA replication protein DnaC